MTGKRITLADYKAIKAHILAGYTASFDQRYFAISSITYYRIKRTKSYADYKRLVNPAKYAVKKQKAVTKTVKVQGVSVKATKLDLMKEHKVTQAKLNYLIELLEKPRVRHEAAPVKAPKLFESWFK